MSVRRGQITQHELSQRQKVEAALANIAAVHHVDLDYLKARIDDIEKANGESDTAAGD